MALDLVKADLLRMYARDPDAENEHNVRITDTEIQKWVSLTGITRQALCDQIGLYLAHGFHRSELTFYFFDSIANDIFGLITSWSDSWPDLF